MKCPGCQQDNPAGQRFCGDCGERLPVLCPSCGAPSASDRRFCGDCGTPLSPASAPEHYAPKHLADRIRTSRSVLEGERKQVSVLFADLKSSMELLADRDPEDAQKLLDPVLERMIEAVHFYEGTVNQVMGDGIMALFGAPLAHEDHAVRACYAALRMQDAVDRYSAEVTRAGGPPIAIRVGLNSGDVVVRSIASDLFMDYSAVGQTTHLAARMEQAASPGSILLTTSTLRLAEGLVQVKALGEIPVKGLSEPVEAFELQEAGTARTRLQAAAARGFTPLVGRQAPLLTLGEATDKALAGHGQIVGLVGDAGVGKSRLVWEVAHSDRARDWLVLESTFTSYGQTIPFFGVVELLRTLFKIEPWDDVARVHDKVTRSLRAGDQPLEDGAPPILALLEALPGGDAFHALDPQERRERTLVAVQRLLLRESYGQPLLLILEDLQWADSETLRCVDAIIGSLPGARICLVLTYRAGYEHRWASKTYYSQLRIDPLAPPNAEALLQALLGNDPSLHALRQIVIERTEGNPFFIEETVRMLAEERVLAGMRGAYTFAGGMLDVQVPGTVQAVLASRIDRLPDPDKRLLQSAALIGKDVPLSLLRAITESSDAELRMSLARLQAAEYLYEARMFPDLEYTFRHGLTHEVAYASLLLERRRELHARALTAMEELYANRLTDHVDSLARHALGGERWDKAVDYLRGSGARAYRRGTLRKALDRYEQALVLLPRLAATDDNVRRGIDVRIDLHPPLFSLGQIPRLTQLHEEAAQLAHQLADEPRLGRVLARLGLYAFADADYMRGIDYAQQALDIADRTEDVELRLVTLYLLGINHGGLGNVARVIELLGQIVDGPHVELAKRITGLSASPYVLACVWMASSWTWFGDFSRAGSYAERAVRAADESDHPYAQAIAYTWRVIPMAYRGEFVAALPLCEVAVALCEKKELLGWLPFAYSLWGWVLSWTGRPTEGVPFIERAITLFETVGIKAFLALRYVEWAEGLLLADNIPEARRAATRAVELAVTHRERASEAWARCLLGDIALTSSAPELDAARAHYGQARALAEEAGLILILGRSHLGLGRLDLLEGHTIAAREHLMTAGQLYRQAGTPYWIARVDEALAASS
jgi:class 3 adenylate cyclase/tetratricopeptide (TPR) repeat protein